MATTATTEAGSIDILGTMVPHAPSSSASRPPERVFLTRPQPSEERPGHEHPAGTEVVVQEVHGVSCLVEVRVPDESLVGGAWYDTIEVSIWDLKAVYALSEAWR